MKKTPRLANSRRKEGGGGKCVSALGDESDVIDLGRNKARSLINGDVKLTSRPTGWCNAGELAGPFIYH